MAIIYVIYKQIFDSNGLVEKLELVECDMDENMAIRFSKLYNLQVPSDLKGRINYGYIGSRVL
jgi:hypothetical protein